MNKARIASMLQYGVAIDTETWCTQPGLAIPPHVVTSIARWNGTKIVGRLLTEKPNEMPNRGRGLAAVRTFEKLLDDNRIVLIFANAPYDLCVLAVEAAQHGIDLLPKIWAALFADRVYDILTAEKLNGIALGYLGKDPRNGRWITNRETGRRGGYSLDNVTEIRTGRVDAKENDEWRLRYGELADVPTEQWPPAAAQYPCDDTCNTLESALIQTGHLPYTQVGHEWPKAIGAQRCVHCGVGFSFDTEKLGPCKPRPAKIWNLHDLGRQVRAHFALKLGGAYGFRVDQAMVDELEARVSKGRAEAAAHFHALGFLKWRKKDGVLGLGRDMAAIKGALAKAYGCTGACTTCNGVGKVPKPKLPAYVVADMTQWDPAKHGNVCKTCGGSKLDLSSAPVPMTSPENESSDPTVSTGRDPLIESGDENLMALARYLVDAKILETYIPWLRTARREIAQGQYLDVPLTLWPNEILDSGRAAYMGVVQLLPRQGGVRECIKARPGTVYITVDYEGGELVTHAQNTTYHGLVSQLAKALNNDTKVHDALAATILGISYEEFCERLKTGDPICKAIRQAVKPANFGFSGRMGAVKLVQQQRKQGPDTACVGGPSKILDDDGIESDVDGFKGLRFCVLVDHATYCGRNEDGSSCMVTERGRQTFAPTCERCINCAQKLREGFLTRWSESDPYFELVQSVEDYGEPLSPEEQALFEVDELAPGQMIQHVTKRVRGGCQGNAIANGYFQALLADAAKDALVEAQRECTDASLGSILLGARVILFAHDELIVECREEIAHECSYRIAEIMIKWLQYYCPDVARACKAEPALMPRWYKGAKAKWRDGGKERKGPDDRLVPWEPPVKKAA